MSPRTSKQLQEIKEQRGLLIIDSALKLFASEGYVTTSMQSIARDAGVSKGNLYNYFESKEELLKQVLMNGIIEFARIYGESPRAPKDEKEFEKLILSNFNQVAANIDFWKLYYNLVAQPGVQHLFSEIFTPVVAEFVGLYSQYYKNKGYKNAETKAMLLGSTFDGIMLGYIVMGESYPIDEVLKELIEKYK
ncbi:MAG: TetR/AcrR family transcriptional regulator [Bacteroidota bacterium]